MELFSKKKLYFYKIIAAPFIFIVSPLASIFASDENSDGYIDVARSAQAHNKLALEIDTNSDSSKNKSTEFERFSDLENELLALKTLCFCYYDAWLNNSSFSSSHR